MTGARAAVLACAALLAVAPLASADPAAPGQRAALERDLQTEAFALQLRQSQARVRAGTARGDLEAQFLAERLEQARLHERQRAEAAREADPATLRSLMQRFARERDAGGLPAGWGPRL